MKMDVIDKSSYLKGLLVLISKDNKVSSFESDLVMKVGKTLGFDKEFTEEALETLLENQYISQEPPKFSSQDFALSFLRDGIKLTVSDLNMCKKEVEFLKATAKINNISEDWLMSELNNAGREIQDISVFNGSGTLEINRHI